MQRPHQMSHEQSAVGRRQCACLGVASALPVEMEIRTPMRLCYILRVQGYLPGQLYNLDSKFGNQEELKALCAALKEAGVRPVCDIVINHRCADAQDEHGIWNQFRCAHSTVLGLQTGHAPFGIENHNCADVRNELGTWNQFRYDHFSYQLAQVTSLIPAACMQQSKCCHVSGMQRVLNHATRSGCHSQSHRDHGWWSLAQVMLTSFLLLRKQCISFCMSFVAGITGTTRARAVARGHWA